MNTASTFAAPDWAGYARAVICAAVRGTASPDPPTVADEPHAGAFVTLHKHGRLRGCMGTLDPSLSRADAVREAAISAALHDPRFQRIAPDELGTLEIEVSILSTPAPMRSLDDLELGKHGIIVRGGGRRGLFLPQVATDHSLDKEAFLSRCCSEKAGLPPDAWRDPATEILLFTTTVFRERPGPT